MAPKKPIKKNKIESKNDFQEKTKSKRSSGGGIGSFFRKTKAFFTDERTKFIFGLFLFIGVIFVALSFLSYFFSGKADQNLFSKLAVEGLDAEQIKKIKEGVKNWAGLPGAYISDRFIHRGFGISSFAMLWFLTVFAFRMMNVRIASLIKTFFHCAFWLVWTSVFLGFVALSLPFVRANLFFELGGEHGFEISEWISLHIKKPITLLLLLGTLLVYCVVSFKSTIPFIKSLFKRKPKAEKLEENWQNSDNERDVAIGTEIVPEEWVISTNDNDSDFIVTKPLDEEKIIEIELEDEDENRTEIELDIEDTPGEEISTGEKVFERYDPKLELSRYRYPTLDLLKVYDNENNPHIDMAEQNANKDKIITTLQNYGIEIDSIKATVGPTITLYEIVPKAGIRISKIRNLEDDIMLSLAARGIRIIAPIPGKGTIGIEVPNNDPQIVSMHSVIASKKFQESKFELPVVFGRTITNENFMVDLVKMPHLLVAGATGQGKSVGLNAIITSLLYKKHPSELKLVLIDPKKVEFNIYEGIEKYFLAKLPDENEAIITDTSKVVQTLNSLCKEMDDRYDLLKKAHTRNIKEYNEKFANRQLNPEKGHRFLPYIVVIVDEFGDLIMTAGKEVEMPIARIAQLARAVGIHMIIATQRPSVNIITGIIKANFPARVAFRVTSMIDSRTILDASGAQQLVGRGDMLFSQGSELTRVQCAFVDTPEVEFIVNFVKEQGLFPTPCYLPEVAVEGSDFDPSSIDMSKRDPMFNDAARMIVQTQVGSTSNIQRKLSLGYNRAGRIMDQLEAAGIVGASEGSKPRQVLIMDEYSLEKILNAL